MTVRQTTLGGASGRGSKNNKRKEPKKSTTKTGKRASSLMKAKAEKAADGADIGTAEGSPVKVVPRHTPPQGCAHGEIRVDAASQVQKLMNMTTRAR